MEKILTDIFIEKFGGAPLIARSPGRINIIGEHTDYNEGFVLPAAIDKCAYVAVDKREDDVISLYSRSFDQSHESSISLVTPDNKKWPNYILGVVDQLLNNGYGIGGFNLVFDGDIPVGSGLSSSAALECATIFALNELFSLNIGKIAMVKMAQLAEHSFVGVKCGIMDQFASMFGKKDHAIKLDCRSLDFEYIPLDLQDNKIVLLNTNVKHELVSSEYNKRRAECEQGVNWVREYEPGVKALRDVTPGMLDKYVLKKDKLIYKRCRYVVEENNRLLEACNDLKSGNLKELGRKMFETHKKLSADFEVSCKELDFLVSYAERDTNVLGARLIGGGFGGCTINIVKEKGINHFIEAISADYKNEMGIELTSYLVAIEQGTSIVKTK